MVKRVARLVITALIMLGAMPGLASGEFAPDILWLDANYTEILGFSEGMAAVNKDGKWGFIDTSGNEVVACIYDRVLNFSEGLASVTVGTVLTGMKCGYINKTGETIIPFDYLLAYSFNDGLAAVTKDARSFGYIDKSGATVIPFDYVFTKGFNDGLSDVAKDWDSWGHIDKDNNEVIPFIFENIRPFSEGLAAFAIRKPSANDDWIWGYIDKNGNEVVPCIYDEAEMFSEGMAAVGMGEWPNIKWGFIDKTGEEVVPCAYDYTFGFFEGVASVQKDFIYKFIDKTGMEAFPFRYDIASKFSEDLAAVGKIVLTDNGLGVGLEWGYIDLTGNEIFAPIYESASDFADGLAIIKKDGKWGILKNPLNLTSGGTIKVLINGEYIFFDQPPIIENGRALVPMRAIFEALGAEVKWDDSTQSVYATRKTDTLVEVTYLKIGDTDMTVSSYNPLDSTELPGRDFITLDVAPKLVGNRTLIPVRAIAEAFGAKVEWNRKTNTVIITK